MRYKCQNCDYSQTFPSDSGVCPECSSIMDVQEWIPYSTMITNPPPELNNILIFDIETVSVFSSNSTKYYRNVPKVYCQSHSRLGTLRIGCVYGDTADSLGEVKICGIEKFKNLWNKAKYIVGFNLQFDTNMLETNGMFSIGKEIIDMYYVIIRSLFGTSYNRHLIGGRKLEQIAVANGLSGKTANIVKLLDQYHKGVPGSIDTIEEYLIRDVEITRDLFLMLLKGELVDSKTKEIIK